MIYDFKYKKGFKEQNGKLWIEDDYLFIELDGIAERINLNNIIVLYIHRYTLFPVNVENIYKKGFFKSPLGLHLNHYANDTDEICSSIDIKFDYVDDIPSSDIGVVFRIIRDNIKNPNIAKVPEHKMKGNPYVLCDKIEFDYLFENKYE